MRLRDLFLPLLIGGTALATACSASCEQACKKLINECDLAIPSYSVNQCTEDCKVVEQDYDEYDYLEDQAEAFQAQLDCIDDSSCEDLSDPESPACYSDTSNIWVF